MNREKEDLDDLRTTNKGFENLDINTKSQAPKK